MNPHEHPEFQAMLKAVAASPTDDLPRLVAADWLDEHGVRDWAEFIRVQCEWAKTFAERERIRVIDQDLSRAWTIEKLGPLHRRLNELWDTIDESWPKPSRPMRLSLQLHDHTRAPKANPGLRLLVLRGFPSEVRCRLASWWRRECRRCRGEGYTGQGSRRWFCRSKRCRWGEVIGVGPELVNLWPIERVVFTDRNPETGHDHNDGSLSCYWRASYWCLADDGIPDEWLDPSEDLVPTFDNPAAADDWLSERAIRWAKNFKPAEGRAR